jgi:hypothetical protein
MTGEKLTGMLETAPGTKQSGRMIMWLEATRSFALSVGIAKGDDKVEKWNRRASEPATRTHFLTVPPGQ